VKEQSLSKLVGEEAETAKSWESKLTTNTSGLHFLGQHQLHTPFD
jgi:hypothetical protein